MKYKQINMKADTSFPKDQMRSSVKKNLEDYKVP